MTHQFFRAAFAAALLFGAPVLGANAAQAAGDPARGKAAFQAQCAICHATVPGKTLVGPSLAGVAGRAAGKGASFAYSPALAKAGFKWDAAHLDLWLTAPAKLVPGNRMPYAGMANAAQRGDVVAYLGTLK
ncbi:c-type cytochrome [Novosphingobium sediminicola]|uniref:Cytochrome c2 n=1 Tax=Novosphingobium sediminicola TaxID=563162 RepID=A0A7W6G6N3_9SPHN|nr:c-type cytochrome [Novosphingobium sediminicola]MBB3954132.1 cytochrome c2 [Novosphingobium sediminicola]